MLSPLRRAALVAVPFFALLAPAAAQAWGRSELGPGGYDFYAESTVHTYTYSTAFSESASVATQTSLQMQYWTGSSWVYKSWVDAYGANDYISDHVDTQFMNAYHKTYGNGQWSETWWTTDDPI